MNFDSTIDLTRQAATAAQQPKPKKTADPAKAKAAAQKFEAFFISQFIQSMFSGIRTDGMFGGGQGENAFRSLLFQEYGKIVAKAGGVGIADAVQKTILKAQENKDQSATQQGTQPQEQVQ